MYLRGDFRPTIITLPTYLPTYLPTFLTGHSISPSCHRQTEAIMHFIYTTLLLLPAVWGRPTSDLSSRPSAVNSSTPHDFLSEFKSPFPIHPSCNATSHRVLSSALWETVAIARSAKEYLLDKGSDPPIVQKYFGTGPTAIPIGIYERIIAANHDGMLFRCDDIDGNCVSQEGQSSQLLTPSNSKLPTDTAP